MPQLSILLATAAFILSCAGSSTPPQPRNCDLISRTQIDSIAVNDAYEVVQRLRPEYLRERGAASIQITVVAVVYIDGLRRGGPEALRTVRTTELQEIRFISANDAVTRYGMDHQAGAIEVKTRQGRGRNQLY